VTNRLNAVIPKFQVKMFKKDNILEKNAVSVFWAETQKG
jgi:hypothetical protein